MKKFTSLLLVAAMLLCMTGGSFALAEADEDITIELWYEMNNVGDPSLPEEEWWITQAIAAYEAEHPNIHIELNIPSGQVEITQTWKAAVVAGTEPDIVDLWTGTNLFPLADLMLDPTEYISQEDFEHITTWGECYLDFDTDKKLLAIPVVEPGVNVCTFYYNKQAFEKAGVDAAEIKTLEDFEAALQKLQDAGYQPITCDDEGYGVGFCCLGIWWANHVGAAGMYADSIGDGTTFAEDEAFRSVLTMANDWYNKGWINQDYATCTESLTRFIAGQAAIFGAGTWYLGDMIAALGEDNLGVMPMPAWREDDLYSFTSMGGNGQGFCISKNCKHPREACDFISFLNSRAQAELAQQQHPVLPARDDVAYGLGEGAFSKQIMEASANSTFYYDNTMRADVVVEFYRLFPLVVTGAMSVDEAIASLDATAAAGA